jgi:hypothetical protein
VDSIVGSTRFQSLCGIAQQTIGPRIPVSLQARHKMEGRHCLCSLAVGFVRSGNLGFIKVIKEKKNDVDCLTYIAMITNTLLYKKKGYFATVSSHVM